MIYRFIIRLLLSIVVVFICHACANIVAPSGGPKDTSPPKVIKSIPENQSILFNSSSIRIYFDEFIKLNNLNNQLLISPPLNNLPDISIKGKSILIKVNDTLLDNTTYNFYFGNAIVDITEGNAYPNYSYVFSTGNYLDSMSVEGNLVDAYTHKPIEDALVMLYDKNIDSLPLTSIPAYITKSDKNGYFKFSHLRNIPYKIFALKDANSNMLYDLPNEQIAFTDTLIQPFFPSPPLSFTKEDSVSDIFEDSTKIGTSMPNTITLYMFEEVDTIQKILKKSLESPNMALFVFKRPNSNLTIDYYKQNLTSQNIIEELNKTQDTLKIWIKDSSLDSLHLIFYDNNIHIDTVSISLAARIGRRPARETLKITPNFSQNKAFPFFDTLKLSFSAPIQTDYLKRITFKEDSVDIFPILLFSDTILKRQIFIDYELKKESVYDIIIPDSVFFDIRGLSHDSITYTFKTNSLEAYGTLELNFTLNKPDIQYIIQLLDDKGKVIEFFIIEKNNKKIFLPHVVPGKYYLKAIKDLNFNGIWDTGNYNDKRYAEPVLLHKNEIVIRAKWDTEIEWEID